MEEKDWQTKIGDLVRETYRQQGFSDVVIAVGAIDQNDRINTEIWFPADTAKDFDLRLMWFAINNHMYYEYNNILDDLED